MNFFLAPAMLALVVMLSWRTPTKPEMVTRDGTYTFFNPTRKDVLFVVGCGSDFEDAKITVKPGTSEQYDIQDPAGHPAACYLKYYQTVK
jgi:hypothetical protein